MTSSIPILDLSEERRDPERFARTLGEGFAGFGFVGIRGHGVEQDLVERAFEAARAFFALPLAAKVRCEVPGGAGQRGYTRFGVEKAKDQQLPDLKEFFHVGREVERGHPLAHALLPNVWPAELPGFREHQLALFCALERAGARVLAVLARYLGLRADWFADRIGRGNSILRAIHYPPVAAIPSASPHPDVVQGEEGATGIRAGVGSPAGRLRAAAHEDINLITLLVGAEEPGLEILTRRSEWIPVTTLPGTIVVNAGDMLQRLTNDRLPSTTHRVVNPPPPWDSRSRHSIPFFLHFDPDVLIETLPSCVTSERPNRYPVPITAHDFLEQRLREIGLRRY